MVTLHYATGSVISSDGTTIGYRRIGQGPGLILVHGGMQAAQNFMKLAAALSDAFTVHILDRRGRGLSGPFGADHCMQREVEDLAAVAEATGSSCVFGLSSGALIALQAASAGSVLRKIALYEPPLVIAGAPGPTPLDWLPPYEAALARGDLAAAMVACLKGTADRELFMALPRFVMTPLMRLAIRAWSKNSRPGDVPLEDLIRATHFDGRIAAEMAGTIHRYRTVDADVLLMGGSRSAAYLPIALDALERAIPHSRRVEFPGLGHTAADDTGRPERVAAELRRFFTLS